MIEPSDAAKVDAACYTAGQLQALLENTDVAGPYTYSQFRDRLGEILAELRDALGLDTDAA